MLTLSATTITRLQSAKYSLPSRESCSGSQLQQLTWPRPSTKRISWLRNFANRWSPSSSIHLCPSRAPLWSHNLTSLNSTRRIQTFSPRHRSTKAWPWTHNSAKQVSTRTTLRLKVLEQVACWPSTQWSSTHSWPRRKGMKWRALRMTCSLATCRLSSIGIPSLRVAVERARAPIHSLSAGSTTDLQYNSLTVLALN